MAITEQEFMELTKNLDINYFWEENELCKDFTEDKPRCYLFFAPDDHWIFEFVKIESTLRYYSDKNYRDSIHREANKSTLKYVGKAFFSEDTWKYQPRRIENLFGCNFEYTEGGTPWFEPVTDDPKEFSEILDKAEKTDIKSWLFSDEFLKEWNERKKAGKVMPKLGDGSRGPATVMSSVLHIENLFFWMFDHPELIKRFRDLLSVKMVEMNKILKEFSGNKVPGWWITDDNCALFNKQLYKEYCFPVLKNVLQNMAPGDSYKYQHSDSNMGHLIEYQRELGINAVNYGPTVDAGLIREQMPNVVIYGHMPPIMLRNDSPETIKERLVSDFEKAGKNGGLQITTAGSLSAGTGVGRMRWLMKLTQDYCRYQ